MTNQYEAVMNFLSTCPLVGENAQFNFMDTADTEENTALYTVPYGKTLKTYSDGTKIKVMQFEIRQNRPFTQEVASDTDSMYAVQQLLNWINTQGNNGNYPDFGKTKKIIAMSTPDGVDCPSVAQTAERGALYAFPFEITYIEL